MRFLQTLAVVVTSAFLAMACGNENTVYPELTPVFGQDEIFGSTPSPGEFKLMSFNVRYQNSSDNSSGHGWDKRREGVYAMLRAEKPVLMGVQECLAGQRSDILKNVPEYNAIGVGRDDGKEAGEIMAIFYLKDSVSIEKWGTFWLSASPDKVSKGWDAACYRTCTWAHVRLKRTGKEFMYFNTHLDHKGTVARRESVRLIVEKIRELNVGFLPCVLTADFNSSEDDAIFDVLRLQMRSARKTATVTDSYGTYNAFQKNSGGSVIDHIFYSGNLTPSEFKTVRNGWKNIDFISDHYPIYAIFAI
jgi:endonuclease/exonuclease/phosphatase family metal-dependent hydrolase